MTVYSTFTIRTSIMKFDTFLYNPYNLSAENFKINFDFEHLLVAIAAPFLIDTRLVKTFFLIKKSSI